MEIRFVYLHRAALWNVAANIWQRSIYPVMWTERKQVGEESDSSGSERSPKQAKRRNRGGAPPATRRRKSGISARERNLRRLESNERERMRMHSLNDAFEVTVYCFSSFRLDVAPTSATNFAQNFRRTRNFRRGTSRTIRVKIMNMIDLYLLINTSTCEVAEQNIVHSKLFDKWLFWKTLQHSQEYRSFFC